MNVKSETYHFLLVEDEHVHQELFKRFLKTEFKRSYELDVAGNLDEAAEKVGETKYDLIFLDLGLGSTRGPKTYERFTELVGVEEPVVVITSNQEESVGPDVIKLGAIDFLTKEYGPRGFLNRVVVQSLERRNNRRRMQEHFNSMKNFSRYAAHDLKAPMNTIGCYVSIINRELHGDNNVPDEVKELLGNIEESIDVSMNLIKKMLSFSALDAASLEIKLVPLSELLEKAVSQLGGAVVESAADIIVDEDLPQVWVDTELYVLLLQNLIGNAIDHRKDGDRPHILVRAREQGDYYIIEVIDRGTGIPEQFLETIFEPFKRCSDKGTGLGLTICRKIAETHGGTITAHSKVGEGSTFRVTLPVRPSV